MLVLAAANWRSSADYRTVLAALVVCAGAIVVLVQSVGAGKYIWAAAFLAVSVLFNPALPISFPRDTFVMLDLVCLVLFAVSLAALKSTPDCHFPPLQIARLEVSRYEAESVSANTTGFAQAQPPLLAEVIHPPAS